MERLSPLRYLLFPVIVSALLLGMWAGLLRMGWSLPRPQDDFMLAHGAWMVCGVLGTLIGLERAVALAGFLNSPQTRQLPYLAPGFTALGALALLVDSSAAALLMSLGSAGLVIIFGFIIRRQPALFTLTMGLGALLWLIGNTLWFSSEPLYEVAAWWIGFLVLTIAGERLELSRLLHPPRAAQIVFGVILVLMLGGISWTRITFADGIRALGISQIGLAAWLLRYDVVQRTIRQSGLTRFIAACLLIGYLWLGVSGAMLLAFGDVRVGMRYDAMLHALFLGFVFSMIFGHAPLILPSVTQVSITYQPRFYLHLGLLHSSLLLRVVGDLWAWADGRRWGGLLNVVVILLFMANTASAAQPVQKRLRSKPKRVMLAYLFPIPTFVIGIALVVLGFVMPWNEDEGETLPPTPNEAAATAEYAPDDILEGKKQYESVCVSCHGFDAQGITGLGKNLVTSEFVGSLSDAELRQFIITGRPMWDAANTTGIEMPPRGGFPALSDTQIDQIIAYLRSLRED